MTSPRNDGRSPTDRAADKTAPQAAAPAKPGATGSSAVPPGGAKPSDGLKPSEPAKPGPTGSSALSSGGGKPSDAPKPLDTPKPSAPLKGASTGSTAVPPAKPAPAGAPQATSPAKPGPTGGSAVPPSGTKGGADRPGAAGAAAFTGAATQFDGPIPGDGKRGPTTQGSTSQGPASQGAARVGPSDAVTDGPILDLKAKRIPDAPKGAEPSASGKAAGAAAAMGAAAGAAASDRTASPTPRVAPAAAPASDVAQNVADNRPKRGPGYGAVAGSGLLGGVIGAGLLFALTQSGVLGPKPADSGRLDALDQRIAALAPRDAVSALDKRVAASEQALKPLPEAVARADAAAKAATEAAQKAGQAPAAAGTPSVAVPPEIAARLDALDQRVSALQEEPGQQGAATLSTAPSADVAKPIAALDERLKALENRPAGPAANDADKLAALRSDLDGRAKANEAADQAMGQRLDRLQQTLDARVASVSEAVQTATQASREAAEAGKAQIDEIGRTVDRKLQEQGETIASLNKALDQSAKATTVQAALRIASANRIATALSLGAPYADALTSLKNAQGGAAGQIEALAPFADKGAPTASALAEEFRGIADRIAGAQRTARARSVAESGGIGDRLMNMAESIVQVKRVGGDAPNSGPAVGSAEGGSTVAVQRALDRGRIAEAAQAFAALPEDARSQAGDFGQRLTARASAGEAAQTLVSDAFTGLPAAGR